LHDVSLADVIGTGRPVAALFATPALCQSQYCGPVLDEMLKIMDPFKDRITFVHTEIYQSLTGTALVPTVSAWGLKSEPDDKPLINARSETAATRAAFRGAFAQRRCLVPADGFYEWQGPKGAKDRQPFHLRMRGGLVFGFAGLWEPGTDNEPPTLALLTTAPNALVETIHDRMPVILPPSEYARWLDPRTAQSALRRLLEPYEATAMEAVPVGTAVNSARVDDASCLAPPAPRATQIRLL
jgi:putative SOS response-associated peptidase YedK